MRLFLAVTIACLVSLFTIGSAIVAQEDPIFDTIKGNFGGEEGGFSGSFGGGEDPVVEGPVTDDPNWQ